MEQLHNAILAQKVDEVLKWLSNGVNVNLKNNDGDSPLHTAITTGHPAIIHELIKYGADPNIHDGWDLIGRTPLHRAILIENFKAVKMLIDAGADMDARSWDGYTPLSLAKALKKHQIAVYLSNIGARE